MRFTRKYPPELTTEENMEMAIAIRETLAGKLTAQDENEFVERLKQCGWWKDEHQWPAKYPQEKTAQPKQVKSEAAHYRYITYNTDKKAERNNRADYYGRTELPETITQENPEKQIMPKELDVHSWTGLYDAVRHEKKKGATHYCVDLSKTTENFIACRDIVLKVLGKKETFQENITILCDKENHPALLQQQTPDKTIKQLDRMNYIFI